MKYYLLEFQDEFDKFIYYIMNLKRDTLKKVGLYVGQPHILKMINEKPGLPQANLARLAGIKASTLNVMLGRMAKNGLVKIKSDKHNCKIKCVYLTDKGKEIQKIGCKIIDQIKQKQYEGFSEKEKNELQCYMSRINENLNNILKKEEEE